MVPVSLRELPPAERDRLLDLFVRRIYEPAFPRPEQREDPEVWRRLLAAPPRPPQPVLDVLLAAAPGGAVAGGIVYEHFSRSNCVLTTYLAVAPEARGQGLARTLIDGAVARLADLAAGRRAELPAMLAEVEDPHAIPDGRDRDGRDRDALDRAVTRQRVLAALGMVACDLAYFQPPLREGEAPVGGLRLCALAATLPAGGSMPSSRLAAFMTEFYACLPTGNDASRQALAAMTAWLGARDRVTFRAF